MTMNKKKGMSQTLALIVAASVLMMTALTVIFLAQGALGDFGQDASNRACNSALTAQSTTLSSGDTSRIPDNCFTGDGQAVNGAPSWLGAQSSGQCMEASADNPSVEEFTQVSCS